MYLRLYFQSLKSLIGSERWKLRLFVPKIGCIAENIWCKMHGIKRSILQAYNLRYSFNDIRPPHPCGLDKYTEVKGFICVSLKESCLLCFLFFVWFLSTHKRFFLRQFGDLFRRRNYS